MCIFLVFFFFWVFNYRFPPYKCNGMCQRMEKSSVSTFYITAIYNCLKKNIFYCSPLNEIFSFPLVFPAIIRNFCLFRAEGCGNFYDHFYDSGFLFLDNFLKIFNCSDFGKLWEKEWNFSRVPWDEFSGFYCFLRILWIVGFRRFFFYGRGN